MSDRGQMQDKSGALLNEVDRLRSETVRMHAALVMLDQWDVLSPPNRDVLADAPWCRKVVDDGLGRTDGQR